MRCACIHGPMLRALTLGTQSVDVLDLKVLLVSHGANLPEDVYRVLAEQYRVQDPGDLVATSPTSRGTT